MIIRARDELVRGTGFTVGDMAVIDVVRRYGRFVVLIRKEVMRWHRSLGYVEGFLTKCGCRYVWHGTFEQGRSEMEYCSWAAIMCLVLSSIRYIALVIVCAITTSPGRKNNGRWRKAIEDNVGKIMMLG